MVAVELTDFQYAQVESPSAHHFLPARHFNTHVSASHSLMPQHPREYRFVIIVGIRTGAVPGGPVLPIQGRNDREEIRRVHMVSEPSRTQNLNFEAP